MARWRQGGYVDITATSRRLLDYWTDPDRDKRFFFCQIEALETAIYLTEVARKYDPWIDNTLRVANEGANPGLFRIAFKMATGTGKNHCVAGVEQTRQLKRPALLRRLSDFGAWHHHS